MLTAQDGQRTLVARKKLFECRVEQMLFFHEVRQDAFREAAQNAGKRLALVHAPAKSAPLRAQKKLQFAQNFLHLPVVLGKVFDRTQGRGFRVLRLVLLLSRLLDQVEHALLFRIQRVRLQQLFPGGDGRAVVLEPF